MIFNRFQSLKMIWLLFGLIPIQSYADEIKSIRVAAISFEPQKLALKENADKLKKLFRKAADGGARLAVAPEGALEGYIVNEIIDGKISPARMKEVALTIDDPLIMSFRQLACELGICLVFGFAEKIGEDIFNTAIFIDDQGKICGKYHKMQLAEGCHPDWWFNRLGTKARAFDTPIGRVGVMICNDRWNPLLAKILRLDGACLLVVPSFGSVSRAQDEAVLARSLENNIPLVEANVGVTLVADGQRIVAVDRLREQITYAEIAIPEPLPINILERDRMEMQFLKERLREMPKRYQKTMEKLKR